MFVLKKIFKLRDKAGGQAAEKPFLEHLEDMRDLIVRIVATLLLSTILCYVFKGTLLDVLRRPIEEVWQKSEKAKLPSFISPVTWEQAKKAANRTAGLSPEQRSFFYSQFEDEQLSYYAECASYYRAALVIVEPEKRTQFIENLPDLDPEIKETVISLLAKNPSDAVDARGDVIFMRSLKPTETFMLAIKLSLFAGIIVSFPLLLFFILQFVIPGLKEKERQALYPALFIAFGLFLAGVFFCYYFVLPKALDFFFEYGKSMGVENEWRIGEYINFATQFTLIFGLAFELPVVVMTLVKIGLLGYETMSNTRAYAVISILLVGAIITPTGDALTLMLLGLPMIILYEACIWLAYFIRKKELASEAEEAEEVRAYVERQKAKEKDDDDAAEPKSAPHRIAMGADESDEDSEEESNLEDDHHADDYFEDADDYEEEFENEEDRAEYLRQKAEHTSNESKYNYEGERAIDGWKTDEDFLDEGEYDFDYDDNFKHDEDFEDEGEEMDDGEVEPHDASDIYTEEDVANFKPEDEVDDDVVQPSRTLGHEEKVEISLEDIEKFEEMMHEEFEDHEDEDLSKPESDPDKKQQNPPKKD